jgi:hypothetical protein
LISGGLVRIQEGQPYFIKRGIAQLLERGFHTPRQPRVRTLLPRPNFAGLAKWEGNGLWPRHEAVRSRQPVRACSSSEERRIPYPRQRGFDSFLARHIDLDVHNVLRASRDARYQLWDIAWKSAYHLIASVSSDDIQGA